MKPATGRLLIAEPFMLDPEFKRSVVLLAEYSADNVVGFVLNNASGLFVNDGIIDFPESDAKLYTGGPCSNERLHFVHRCPHKISGGTAIGNGIYWGGDFESVKMLFHLNLIGSDEIRFFLGYSGWEKGQLDRELELNSWIVSDKFDLDLIFSEEEENTWKEAITNLGERYAHIVNFPTNPQLN